MKNLVLVSLCAILGFTAAAARADVCQKDDNKLRVRVVKDPDGRIVFLEGTGKKERFIGPEVSFSSEELKKARRDAQAIITHVKVNDTGNGFLALFTIIAVASDPNGRMIAATHSGPDFPSDSENRAKIPHAKEIVDALDYSKIYPTKNCMATVDSIAAYKANLANVLAETYGQRFSGGLASAKTSDEPGVKSVPAAGSSKTTKVNGNSGPKPAR